MAWLLMCAINKVLPSPGCLATKSAAMVPDAPALFSMMTWVFHIAPSFCPTTRARMSVPPPGAKPTMMRTGPVGRFCAQSMGAAMLAAVAVATVTNVLRCMVGSPGWGSQRNGKKKKKKKKKGQAALRSGTTAAWLEK